MPSDEKDSRLWYVRRAGKLRGPFPPGQISREILLGRIRDGDEFSHDRQHWQPLAELPQLIPEVMRHAETEPGRQRLRLARLHEDERLSDRRHEAGEAEGQRRRHGDRRDTEPLEAVAHRDLVNRWAHEEPVPERNGLLIGATLVVALAILLFFFLYRPAVDVAVRDCASPAAAGVNWNSCDLAGRSLNRADLAGADLANAVLVRADLSHARLDSADLGYANLAGADVRAASLQSASLKGAVLRGANLAGSDLRHADLGYADLTGATLGSARLDGAKLGKTIWLDGRVCAPESVSACR